MDSSPQAFSPSVVYRSILAVDIEGFSSSHRTDRDRIAVREAMHRILDRALAGSAIGREGAHIEDRGDGLVMVLPPAVPQHLLVTAIPNSLARALREHNQAQPPETRIRLRMAVHAGYIGQDEYGVVGLPVDEVFRLLDDKAARNAMADPSIDLALVASQWVYEDVIHE